MLKEIRRVFTKEYKEDIAYLELKRKMKPFIKLKNESESMDVKIGRLKKLEYKSFCHINVGEFR